MKFYRVDDNYIMFLRGIDNKVQDNYKGKRVYLGVVLTINTHTYFAPLSSYKPSQDKIKNITVFKLHDRTDPNNKLGVIHLNNMIPVLPSEITYVDFKNEKKPYSDMLQKQYEFITSKRLEIEQQAQKLYNAVTVQKNPFFSNLSCDFEKLEESYLTYQNSVVQ